MEPPRFLLPSRRRLRSIVTQIMNYDPNLTNSGRMADQTVKLTFALWEYRVEMEAIVGGNCTGLDVIRTAVSNAYDKLPTRGPDEIASIVLTKPGTEDTMESADEDDKQEDWLADMLIKAEIVSIVPQKEEDEPDEAPTAKA